jgi:hypothetical protein
MGLSSVGSAFSTDVLRIEIAGPRNPHLTMVDLPGLIHSENKAQTEAGIEIILKRAKAVDPRRLRTLGLITKPDTLPSGSNSEAAFVQLAINEDVTFSLGWHALKNRDF